MTDTNLPAETRPKPPALQAGGAVGALVPQTLEEGFRLAQAMAMSGMTPRDIDTPEKVLVAIMAGAELGMKPFQAVQSFAIVNGRPSLWGDGLMALALTNGLDVEEWMEGDGDARVAHCRVTRPDNGKVVTRTYSVDDAKTARLWGKVSSSGKPSPWVTQPGRMLQMRARGYAIRDAAADVLRGMPIKEEIEDFIEANPGVMEKTDRAAGTGLLGKLEATQALATEGFGIRDVDAEAGQPEPEAKPKKRQSKAKAEEAPAETGTMTAYETEAMRDLPPLEELVTEVSEGIRDLEAGITAVTEAPAEPVEAEVEPEAAQTAPTVIDGPAPADMPYFVEGKPAFPSGRRIVFINGEAQKDTIEDTPDVPTYAEHATKVDAPLSAPAVEAPAEPTASDQSPSPSDESTSVSTTASPDGGATSASPSDAHQTFHADLTAAKSGADIVVALRALFASGECGTPDLKREARIAAWGMARELNEDGAKIDPIADPFLLASFFDWSDDVEAVEGALVLARDQRWFIEGGEGMQAGVARAALDRTTALRSG